MRGGVRPGPDLGGTTCLVTGASAGLGFHTTAWLAGHGARVLLGSRDAGRGSAAREAVLRAMPEADVEVVVLDLADLRSIRIGADAVRSRTQRLDLLCNVAGVMAVPRSETVDGFETQIGVNHLGHFALTGLVLDRLLAAPRARVVTVSSLAHRRGRLDLEDLHGRARYGRFSAYRQSKLANVLFAAELQRRFVAAGVVAESLACHPGHVATDLPLVGARLLGHRWLELGTGLVNRVFGQAPERGIAAIVHAATAAEVQGGEFWGPRFGLRGAPRRLRPHPHADRPELAAALWARSEQLTGVAYELPCPSASRSQ